MDAKNNEHKKNIERTFVAVKPDGVSRSIVGKIISRFEDAGLKIIGLKLMKVTPDFAKKHYTDHITKPFYPALETYITEGPIVAMVIEGLSAVATVRKIVGSTEPFSSSMGTIRGDFAHGTYEYADANNIAIRNLIHASGNNDEAVKEIKLYFRETELFEYKTAIELVNERLHLKL